MPAHLASSNGEPSFEKACQWWTDTTSIYTPLGWKDHLFRFNVLWNGTILAEPNTGRRGRITGNVFTAPLAIYLVRLCVIDDELHDDELHLLRFLPAAWAKPDDACRFEHMPTMFGPVTLRTTRSKDGKTLQVDWKPSFRVEPRRVVLYNPPLEGLSRLVVNGRVQPRGKKMVVLA